MNIGRRGKASKHPGKSGPYAYAGKTIVLGMLEKGGRVVTKVVPNVKRKTLVPRVKEHVQFGTEVHTDALQSYLGLEERITAMSPEARTIPEERLGEPMYEHKVVDHAIECVFRPNRTPIPGEADHPFRAKPNTQTGQGEHPGA